jgi:hypothetical protein
MGLAARSPERAEIMLSQQGLGGAMHDLLIQRIMDPRRTVTPQGGAVFPVKNQVTIGATYGAEACVEILRNFSCPQDVYIITQVGIGAAHPGMGLSYRRGVHVNNLAGGMHSGIGAPGANHPNWLIGHARQGSLQLTLDTESIILNLPPHESGAVVFNT